MGSYNLRIMCPTLKTVVVHLEVPLQQIKLPNSYLKALVYGIWPFHIWLIFNEDEDFQFLSCLVPING